MSRKDAFDETEEAFFQANEVDPVSLRPVTLQSDADDEAEAERAAVRARRRDRFVQPVTRTVAGLAAASALAFGWQSITRESLEEVRDQAAAPSEGEPPSAPVAELETPGEELVSTLSTESEESEVNECAMAGETMSEAELVSMDHRTLAPAPTTPESSKPRAKRPAKKPAAPALERRGPTSPVSRQALLAKIRSGVSRVN
jgi:hypothetical protein